ncbi:MAG: WYL domain-containing protein [Verrucomicrobia bacterium]|nr:WYL domain-containing protein [Verrucomicrobiota bacterium]
MGKYKKSGRTKPVPRQTSRPPLERMLKIHQTIKSGGFPNATNISSELEVVRKTVYRDIEFMRDRLGLPLEYDPVKAGYYYTEEVSSFPALEISEGELFSLMIAEKALRQYRGTPFEKTLQRTFNKIAGMLSGPVSLHLQDWEDTVSFKTSAAPMVDEHILKTIAKSTEQRRQIEIVYRKPGTRSTDRRMVDPYHLANINGDWFLFGFCHLRNDVRTFVPTRIIEAKFTGKTFKRPKGFSLEKTLRGSFGVCSGTGSYNVVIRFTDKVADYIREKQWHPSQKLRSLKNGGVELRLNLSSLEEIKKWILSWSGNAEVIAPPELIREVRKAAEKILEVSAQK